MKRRIVILPEPTTFSDFMDDNDLTLLIVKYKDRKLKKRIVFYIENENETRAKINGVFVSSDADCVIQAVKQLSDLISNKVLLFGFDYLKVPTLRDFSD